MLSPPRNFAFTGSVERSGAFAAFGVDPRMAVAPINGVRLASSDTNCCAGRYFTPFPFSLQFVSELPLSSIMTNDFEV